MDIETLSEKIKAKVSDAHDIKAKIKFDFGDDGVVFINSHEDPPKVSHDAEAESDVTLICSLDTFENILKGSQDPNIAFMMGKLKVKGSMGLAMKLNGILED